MLQVPLNITFQEVFNDDDNPTTRQFVLDIEQQVRARTCFQTTVPITWQLFTAC